MTNPITTFIAATAASASTALAQLPPEAAGVAPLVIQAGMAGVVVIILLKSFPMLAAMMERQRKSHEDAMERQRKSHEATIRRLVEVHAQTNKEWQDILLKRKPADRPKILDEQSD